MKVKYKKYELSGKIVRYLLDQLQLPTAMLFYPRSEIYKLFNADEYSKKARIMRVLNRLKLNKFIRIRGLGDNIRVEITPFGRKGLSESNMRGLSLPRPKKWDGKWRVVMFDIPEKKRKARNAISLKLKQLGFRAIQRSVFVYPFECADEINFIKAYFGVKNEINYMLVSRLEGEKILRKCFNLL